MKQPLDAIAWWKIRRIPFNLLMLPAGLASGFIVASVGSHVFKADQDIGSPFIEAVFYVLANLCYTLGWITEILWGWGDTRLTEAVRPKVFRPGLLFSVGLTFLPATILCWLGLSKVSGERGLMTLPP